LFILLSSYENRHKDEIHRDKVFTALDASNKHSKQD